MNCGSKGRKEDRGSLLWAALVFSLALLMAGIAGDIDRRSEVRAVFVSSATWSAWMDKGER